MLQFGNLNYCLKAIRFDLLRIYKRRNFCKGKNLRYDLRYFKFDLFGLAQNFNGGNAIEKFKTDFILKIKKETKNKMNIDKIEKDLANKFENYPDWLQIILMVSFYPVLCTIGLITLSGWFIVIDFLLRG